jgi:Spy/CpxP family protein refolding chaperone
VLVKGCALPSLSFFCLNLLIVLLVKTLVQINKPSHTSNPKGKNHMFRNIKKALAIACVTVAVGAVTIPNLVSAQNAAQNTTSRVEKNKRGDGWKKLNLTDAQKAQLKTIRENAKTQRQAVFTPDQLAKLEQARKSGDRKGVWKTLNLTDAQKQQLKAIEQTTKDQMKAVLTPEQQQQLAQMKQDRKANRSK